MPPLNKIPFAISFIVGCSLLVLFLNALLGIFFSAIMLTAPSFSLVGLALFLVSIIMGTAFIPGLVIFIRKKSAYLHVFGSSALAVLAFVVAISFGGIHDYLTVWLLVNIVCLAGIWKERILRRSLLPAQPTLVQKVMPAPLYERFIVPVETQVSGDFTRIHFASSKDTEWIANGMLVTLSQERTIVVIEFISREFGIGRWTPSGVSTIAWENGPRGRAKWQTPLAQASSTQTLDRAQIVDILRLIENPGLRRAIEASLDGNEVKWETEFGNPPLRPTDG